MANLYCPDCLEDIKHESPHDLVRCRKCGRYNHPEHLLNRRQWEQRVPKQASPKWSDCLCDRAFHLNCPDPWHRQHAIGRP